MNFLGIDPLEVLIILLIAYLVLGTTRMLEIARSLGKFIQEIRTTAREIPDLLALEEASKEPTSEGDGRPKARQSSSDSEERAGGG